MTEEQIRAAQAAMTGMVLFIAEFEERMQKEIDYERNAYEQTGHLIRLERYEAVCNIAKIYHTCKERIEIEDKHNV